MKKSFVFKGGFKVRKYNFHFEGNVNLDFDMEKYIQNINELFYHNISKMNEKLKSIEKENWSTEEIEQISEDIISDIRTKYIDNQSLEWKIQLISIFSDIYDKMKLALDNVDKMYDDELDRCEEIYNLLDCMFPNIEEIITIRFENYKKIDKIMLPNIVEEREYTINRDKDRFINVSAPKDSRLKMCEIIVA